MAVQDQSTIGVEEMEATGVELENFRQRLFAYKLVIDLACESSWMLVSGLFFLGGRHSLCVELNRNASGGLLS